MRRWRDSGFPGLGTALDAGAVLDLLRRALPECGDGVRLLRGNVVDVRYKPGGPCWLLYRLKVRGRSGRSGHPLLSGRMLRSHERPGHPPRELLARYQSCADRVLDTPMVYLPDVPMVLYAFPVDASLPGLFDALDPSSMRRHLNRIWAHRKVRVRRVAARPLGYTPQARAAVHYEVLGESRETGVPEVRRLIGKMHAKKDPARLFADAWALWRAGGERINLAAPVGYVGSVGLALQEQIRGERLGGRVTSPRFVNWVRETARILATMHGLALPLSSRRKPEQEAQGVHRWAGLLAAIRPDLTERVARLRDRLASEIEARARLVGPIHADFHHTNVLVHDDHVTIIDLDEMAYGDPMVDVGRFLASLRIPALRAFGDVSGLAEAGEAFLGEYLTQAPGEEERARLFEAASLLIAAASSFRIQRPTWEEEVTLLVEEAERVARAARCGSGAGTGKSREPRLSEQERERWANDGVYMRAALDRGVRTMYGAEVSRVVVRPKADGSDRIRYDLRGRRRDERWVVSLEGIARRGGGGHAFVRRLEELRAALEGSPQAPLLPRPVAYLRPLSLVVWEAPSGARFSSLIGSGDAAEAAHRVARALSALHRTTLELESVRSVEDELRALRQKVERLEQVRCDLAARAVPLLLEVERRSRGVSATLVPILRTLHPHHILVGERVAFDKVEEVTLSHPFIDAGDLLARIALMGIAHDRVEEACRAADRFRDAYAPVAAAGGDGMPPFEAAALLRLACAQAKREPHGTAAPRLLERAEACLAC